MGLDHGRKETVALERRLKSAIRIGDRARIRLDTKFGRGEGWYEGMVFKIDPYSDHRSFYWVNLDVEAQALSGVRQISIFNPKHIQKIETAP